MSRRDLLFCLALLLATLAVYSQVTHFEFVNYDDPDYTSANPHIRTGVSGANLQWAVTSSYAANWFPLTWMSHMLDYQLFGSKPGAHHATNLALHILNTLILFLLLRRMTGASVASAFVAFVFALHPLHVESVAWISDRKDLLCTFFFLSTIAAYLNFVRRPTTARYVLIIVFFACALMSKGMAVTLPFVLLLLDYWPLRQFATVSLRRLTVEKLPLFAMAAAASIVTFFAQRGGGAVVDSIPFGIRVENALVSYAVYLMKFVWPVDLAAFYPYAEIPLWEPIASGAALLAITAFVILRREKRPSLMIGWFWFLGTLIPVIGLVQVGLQARADRYTYIPMIGIAIMLAWPFRGFVTKRKWLRPPLALLTILICAGWAAVSWRDVNYWHDSTALFQRAIDVTENNYVAYSNLGSSLQATGHSYEAVQSFHRALDLRPHFADAEMGLSEALASQRRFDEAMPHALEAVRLEPKSATAHIDLGAAYSRRGQAKEAEGEYRAALALDPEREEAHGGLGVALSEQDRLQEALPELQESVRLNPDYADGRYNLGRALGLLGRDDEAMVEFREAIRVEPSNAEAHYNLATALVARDRISQAMDEYRAAVDLRPDYVKARFGYASAVAALGKYEEAIPQFEALLRLAPDFEPAKEALENCRYLLAHPDADPSGEQKPHRKKKRE